MDTESNLKTKFSSKTVIVFDFDGTIADTFNTILKILDGLSEEFGFKKIESNQIEKLRNRGIRELMKEQTAISMARLPFLVRRIRNELNKKLPIIAPIEGIGEALSALTGKGYKTAIISSNSKENIEKFLKDNGIHIDFIYSGSSVFGKSRVINSFIKNEKLNRENMVYVGDEIRDIEAAHKSHIFSIAVSWGYNSEGLLMKAAPNMLIHKPAELEKIFY